jgi:predicted GH43/DUF377 family glycosyl hydrolase
MENDRDTIHTFTCESPREAALKAADMGFSDIRLREHEKNKKGEYKVHVFEVFAEKPRKSKKSSGKTPGGVTGLSVRGVGTYYVTGKLKTSAPEPPKARPSLTVFGSTSMIKPAGDGWESYATFNPAAIYDSGKVHLLYRAVGAGNRSVLGYASSRDGFHIDERLKDPVFELEEENAGGFPIEKTEKINFNYVSGGGFCGGCEDPRITKIDNRFYVPFVYFDGRTPPRLALTSIKADNFLNRKWKWKTPVFMSPPGVVDKNPAILPEKINGKYVIFHRIFPSILIDFVDDLNFDGKTKWLKGEFSIKPREGMWDSRKLGVGPTPIKTKDGWLVIYHAVDDKCPYYNYKIGAMLLDLKDPTKVLHRCNHPVLEPQKDDFNIIYPCGAVIIKDTLFVYYGSRDTEVKVATANLNEFLDALTVREDAEIKVTEHFDI